IYGRSSRSDSPKLERTASDLSIASLPSTNSPPVRTYYARGALTDESEYDYEPTPSPMPMPSTASIKQTRESQSKQGAGTCSPKSSPLRNGFDEQTSKGQAEHNCGSPH